MIARRRFLQLSLGSTCLSLPPLAFAASRPLVILTSYPQDVISRYLDAFNQAYPQSQVSLVWHSGDDARNYLRGPGRGKVDVYWAPSVRSFHDLKQEGAFRKLEIDRTGLPGRIGQEILSDPDGMFEATEIAGYGFAINPSYLAAHKLPVPAEWTDLARPIYAGHLTMPVPSRIGFAPTITEILLQSYGWERGWAVLARIAANAELQNRRGDELLGPVIAGEKGIGITIDFFAAQSIAHGAPLRFIYPTANAFEPATIAIPKDAPNPAAALNYVNFVLSDRGQRLLIDPDLRRLAIRPASYSGAPADYFNPWDPKIANSLHFDQTLFVRRRDLDNAVFDRLITSPRDKAAPLWATINRLSRSGQSPQVTSLLEQAEAALTAVPIAADQAAALAPAFVTRKGINAPPSPEAQAAEAEWTRFALAQCATATTLLARAEAMVQRG